MIFQTQAKHSSNREPHKFDRLLISGSCTASHRWLQHSTETRRYIISRFNIIGIKCCVNQCVSTTLFASATLRQSRQLLNKFQPTRLEFKQVGGLYIQIALYFVNFKVDLVLGNLFLEIVFKTQLRLSHCQATMQLTVLLHLA